MLKVRVAGVSEMRLGVAVPVPVSGTVCGLLGSLSAMLSVALSAACVVGVKITTMLQVAPTARLVPQVEFPWVKSAELVPVNEITMFVRVLLVRLAS